MKILVIGATGKTGQKLLAQLQNTKHLVSGLIRQEQQVKSIKQFGATPLLGDLEKFDETLVKGFDAVIFVAGSGGKNVQGIDYQGLAHAVDAAAKNHVERFLYIGSINSGKSRDQFIQELENFYANNNEPTPEELLANAKNPRYQTYVEMKDKAENHLTHSNLNYTILRAGLLTQEAGSGKVNVTEGTLNAFGQVSRENVAGCFIAALENANTFRKIYTVLDGDTPINQAW